MKRIIVLFAAVMLVFAVSAPVGAVDSEFGGYWRTRAYTDGNFTGEDDTEAKDVTKVDTRTRLYYTAVFSDDLKFVNKFEFDASWGAPDSLGDIGADGKVFEVKNSYANFNTGSFNWLVGIQGRTLARGFLFADDFAGVALTYKGDNVSVPLIWMKANEGGSGKDANDEDVDYYIVTPKFTMDSTTINPYLMYVSSKDASSWAKTSGNEDVNVYFLGLDLDVNLGAGSVWFTGIYEGGEVDLVGGDTIDVAAYVAALGGSVKAGGADIHGQVFYATGDDDGGDSDAEDFFVPQGQSYYWSEIMGYGTFDNQVSANSPADQVSNILAANIGATFKPMDDLSITADLWYAALAEDDAAGNTDLGTEIDLKATYKVVDNLKLDVIAAYLLAGDATYDGDNDANPYELGLRLSLSF